MNLYALSLARAWMRTPGALLMTFRETKYSEISGFCLLIILRPAVPRRGGCLPFTRCSTAQPASAGIYGGLGSARRRDRAIPYRAHGCSDDAMGGHVRLPHARA